MPNPRTEPIAATDINTALRMIIDMAVQGAVDMYDNPSEYRRQMAAVRLVRETFNTGGELQ